MNVIIEFIIWTSVPLLHNEVLVILAAVQKALQVS